MNARDMIALMEYTKGFSKPEKPRRFRKQKEKPLDFYELLRKEEEKVTLFKKFIEDFEKTHKKDEKKDDKKKDEKKTMGAIELFILATLASPMIFLFELWAYSFVVDYIKHMVH
jgi:hypothetical protein